MKTNYLKNIFCLLVCGIMAIGNVYADGEDSDDDWSTYDDEDGTWGDEVYGSDYSSAAIAARHYEAIAEGYPDNSNFVDVTGRSLSEIVNTIIANWDNPSFQNHTLFYPGSDGVFDFEGYLAENNDGDKVFMTNDFNTVMYVNNIVLSYNNSQNTSQGFVFTGIGITRPSGQNSGNFANNMGSFVFGGGIDNHDGTTTYTSVTVNPNENFVDVSPSFGNFISVENIADVHSIQSGNGGIYSSNNQVTLSGTDNYEDYDSTGAGPTATPKQIPITDLATRASLSGNRLIATGIVFEDPPFSYGNYTTLEINNLSKSYNVVPAGHILMDDLGVVGTYQLTGDSNASYYNRIRIWLDVEGVSGINNLTINVGRSHHTYLESYVLPPQYGWTEDEELARIVPAEIVLPGESFEVDCEVTLENVLGQVDNGKDRTGVFYDNNGDIQALYKFDEQTKEVNGDGTMSYYIMEITATEVLTPFEPLELVLHPMTEANENDYSFNVPYDNYNGIDEVLHGKIKQFLEDNDYSEEAINEATLTAATEASEVPWTLQSGTFMGKVALTYKAVRTINENGTNLSQFLLTNDDVISTGLYGISEGSTEVGEEKTYYYNRVENLWYEYEIPSGPNTSEDIEYIINQSLLFGARYIVPVEDLIILIDGKDLDGTEANRYVAAGFLLVSIIPGSRGLKGAKPLVKIVDGISEYRKIVTIGGKNIKLPVLKLLNGIVDFGTESANRSALRRVLQLTTGDGKHAHHIIPWNFRDFDLIQKAAKSNKVFHISEKINGIPLPSTNHLTGHSTYNTRVGEILNTLNNSIGSNEDLAYDALKGFIDHLDNLIKTHPEKNLGQIADLINYP